ncbi:MAG: hypothetical protein JNG90_17850 [Planctomycetaceae bacterium]|nr:hypothetical protein [Planctomycetaceae bacterium]
MVKRDDGLADLLRRADAEWIDAERTDAGSASSGLLDRVYRLQRTRRRRRQRMAIVAAASLLVGGVLWQFAGRATTELPVPVAREQDSMERIARNADLESDLRIARQVAWLLTHDVDETPHQPVATSVTWDDAVQVECEVVAQRMLVRADEQRLAMLSDNEALATYQNLVEWFPHTPAAEVARGRLAEFRN